jgi:hypothetical protein
VYYFLSFCKDLFLFIFSAHLEFPCKFSYSWGYSAVSKLSPGVLSWGGQCFFCSTRHFRNTNSTPLILISRHLAQFDKLSWKVIILKGLFFAVIV